MTADDAAEQTADDRIREAEEAGLCLCAWRMCPDAAYAATIRDLINARREPSDA